MSRSTWYKISYEILYPIIKKCFDNKKTRVECKKECIKAYPFGDRSCTPYKQWCKCQKYIMGLYYPNIKYKERKIKYEKPIRESKDQFKFL